MCKKRNDNISFVQKQISGTIKWSFCHCICYFHSTIQSIYWEEAGQKQNGLITAFEETEVPLQHLFAQWRIIIITAIRAILRTSMLMAAYPRVGCESCISLWNALCAFQWLKDATQMSAIKQRLCHSVFWYQFIQRIWLCLARMLTVTFN